MFDLPSHDPRLPEHSGGAAGKLSPTFLNKTQGTPHWSLTEALVCLCSAGTRCFKVPTPDCMIHIFKVHYMKCCIILLLFNITELTVFTVMFLSEAFRSVNSCDSCKVLLESKPELRLFDSKLNLPQRKYPLWFQLIAKDMFPKLNV